MVQFYRQLLYIRGKSLGHKTKQPLFHLGILRNVNNFYKIVDIFQIFLIFFSAKKWEIMLLNYFHEYAILLHLYFSVLTVDRESPLSVKRSGGGWEEVAPFQRNEAAICHVSRRSRKRLGPVIGKLR
jgi:hypothetical protein